MKRLCAIALAGLAAACSTSVTSPAASAVNTPPAATLLQTRYQWTCGGWGTVGPPPISRTVFDILLTVSPDSSPNPKAFPAVVAAGGNLIYRFHSDLYRVELDVAALSQLATEPGNSIAYARTVKDLDDLVVPFFGSYQPPATDADLINLVSAGAFQLRVDSFSTTTLVSGFIDDSRWPTLSAFPFKFFGLNLPLLCTG